MKFGDSYIGQPVYFNNNGSTMLGYIRDISVTYNVDDVYVTLAIAEDELFERHISDVHDAKGIY